MAGNYPIKAKQGDTFNLNFTLSTDGVAWNLTSYTARFVVKTAAVSPTKILDVSSPTNITLSSTGIVNITISSATMQTVPAGSYVYDFQLTSSGGVVATILEGRFLVRDDVAK